MTCGTLFRPQPPKLELEDEDDVDGTVQRAPSGSTPIAPPGLTSATPSGLTFAEANMRMGETASIQTKGVASVRDNGEEVLVHIDVCVWGER